MSIEFTKVEASTRQAFYDTLLMFWDQHWEKEFQQEFLAWRYGRRTDGETLVVMSGSKCIGMIDSFIRPYRIGGQEVLVREPCDWYCLPGLRRRHAPLEVPHLSRRTLVGGRPLERDDGNCATDELDAPARYARLHLADHRPPGGRGHSAQSEAWGRIGREVPPAWDTPSAKYRVDEASGCRWGGRGSRRARLARRGLAQRG
jgi:hypothetical protein